MNHNLQKGTFQGMWMGTSSFFQRGTNGGTCS